VTQEQVVSAITSGKLTKGARLIDTSEEEVVA